jgi:hypothetical protein
MHVMYVLQVSFLPTHRFGRNVGDCNIITNLLLFVTERPLRFLRLEHSYRTMHLI